MNKFEIPSDKEIMAHLNKIVRVVAAMSVAASPDDHVECCGLAQCSNFNCAPPDPDNPNNLPQPVLIP